MRKITYYRFLKAFYLNNWRMQNCLENILQLFNQVSEIVIMPAILLTLVASAQFGSLLVYVHLILFPIYFYFGGQQNCYNKFKQIYANVHRSIV